MVSDAIRSRRARITAGIRENIRRAPSSGLFWWALLIIILSVLVVASWFFSIFVFDRPELPQNYSILKRFGKLEPLKRYEAQAPPRGRFRSTRDIYDKYFRYDEFLLGEVNAIFKRNYIESFKRADTLSFLRGEFIVVSCRELGPDDAITSGLAVYAHAIDYPNLHIEYILPGKGDDLSPERFLPGTLIVVGPRRSGPADFATLLHVAKVGDTDLRLTVIPLTYRHQFSEKETVVGSPPDYLNFGAPWPIMGEIDDSVPMPPRRAEAVEE
jgi:hypothetical protein